MRVRIGHLAVKDTLILTKERAYVDTEAAFELSIASFKSTVRLAIRNSFLRHSGSAQRVSLSQLLLLGGSEDKEQARSLLALDKIVTMDVHFNRSTGRLGRPEGKSGMEKAPLPCS